MSDLVDERWMLVGSDYKKLVKMSGAEEFGVRGKGLSSKRMHNLLARRWKMFGLDASVLPSSLSSSRDARQL
jgi:hypothetical protein